MLTLFQLITQPADPKQARALAANFHATLTVIEGLKTRSAIRYNTSSKRGKDSKRTGVPHPGRDPRVSGLLQHQHPPQRHGQAAEQPGH